MLVNDPIADMLTRIRNALVAKHDSILVPASNEKKALAKILLDEGFIKSVDYVEEGVQGAIKIGLKYDANRKSVITGLKRIFQARPSRLCEERGAAQGSWRPGHCHHFDVQGRHDR